MAETSPKSLYDSDFAEWSKRTAALIRAGRLTEIETENVAEEIEDLSRSQQSAVASQLRRLLMHKVKQLIQPERSSRSWLASIESARQELQHDLEISPSLRRYLRDNLQSIYNGAVQIARIETGSDKAVPDECPWDLDSVLD